ncbi:hypothetical protein AB0M46_10590 [Dactylosporangium sp. NPDC051485]
MPWSRTSHGYEPLGPGLTWVGKWRPDPGEAQVSHGYGGVGAHR